MFLKGLLLDSQVTKSRLHTKAMKEIMKKVASANKKRIFLSYLDKRDNYLKQFPNSLQVDHQVV